MRQQAEFFACIKQIDKEEFQKEFIESVLLIRKIKKMWSSAVFSEKRAEFSNSVQ